MAKRVLITGASGFLGRAIFKEFRSCPDWSAVGLAFSRVTSDLQQVDLTDKSAVFKVVSEFKPDVIVHSAAQRKPDIVENHPEATEKINVDSTRYICEAAATANAWVLFISTDYVFDGTKPPYKVSDEPNPLNKYGQSKLEGEKTIQRCSEEFGVLRVPILYGDTERLDEGAVSVLFGKVKVTTQDCLMSDYERRYPTLCSDVAFVVRRLSEKRMEDPSVKGIFHWSGDENVTKYDMAVSMATAFDLPTGHIKADKAPASGAPRPYDSHLDCSRVEDLGICKRTKFADAIKGVLSPFYP